MPPAGGAGLAGPPGRPPDPPPLQGRARSGSTNSSPTAAPAAPSIVDRLVAHAIAAYDPETHEDREDDAQAGWDVTLTHPEATDFLGTSHLEATGDTLVLKEFYDQVCAIAHQLFLDGDTDPLGVRKIKAIGILTGQPPTARQRRRSRSTSGSTPHDLEIDGDGGSTLAVGEIEKLGAATLTKIRTWVGHHQVVIQPVLNMARRDAVDSHDPPGWMRDLVHLRDGHCIFPRCPSTPGPATSTTPSPTTRTDHPAKPDPTTSPPCAGDTTAPRPPAAGATSARPTATTMARPARHDLRRHALTATPWSHVGLSALSRPPATR